jgi:hypothetical protein
MVSGRALSVVSPVEPGDLYRDSRNVPPRIGATAFAVKNTWRIISRPGISWSAVECFPVAVRRREVAR